MLKKIVASIIVIAMFISVSPALAVSDIAGHWANNAIQRWTEFGAVRGYDDGTFRPDNHITRAEFATLLNRVLGSTELSDVEFPDVDPNSWYALEIARAVAAGFMLGDAGGTMRPNDNVTREEAVVMLFRAFGIEFAQRNLLIFFDTPQISYWALNAVISFTNEDIIRGFPDGSFRPQNYITRAEVVVLIDRIESGLSLIDSPPKPVSPPSTLPPNIIGGWGGGGRHPGGFTPPPQPPEPPQPPVEDNFVFEIPEEIRISNQNQLYLIDIIELSDNAVVSSEFLEYSGDDMSIRIGGHIDEIGKQILLTTNWWWNVEPGMEFTLEFTAARGDETLTRQLTVIIDEPVFDWNDTVDVRVDVILPNVGEENPFISYTVWFREINTGRIFGGGWGRASLPVGEFEVIAGGVLRQMSNFSGITEIEESNYVEDYSIIFIPPPPPPAPRPFVMPEYDFDFIPSVRPRNVVITQEDADNFRETREPKELPSITLVPRAQRLFSISGTIIAPSGVTGTAYVTLRSRFSDFYTRQPLYTRMIEVPINGVNTQYRFDNVPIGVYDISVDFNRTDITYISTVLTQNRTNQNIALIASDRELGRAAGTVSIDRELDFDISVWVSISRGYDNICPESGFGSSWSVTYWSQSLTIPSGQMSVDFYTTRLPVGEYAILVSANNTLTGSISDTVNITSTTVQKDFEFTAGYRISGRVENWQRFILNQWSSAFGERIEVRLTKEDSNFAPRTVLIAPFPPSPVGFRQPNGIFSFPALESGTYTLSVVFHRRTAAGFQAVVFEEIEIIIDDNDVLGVNFNLADSVIPYEIQRIEFEGEELSQDPYNPTVLSYISTLRLVGNDFLAGRMEDFWYAINGGPPRVQFRVGFSLDAVAYYDFIGTPMQWGVDYDETFSIHLYIRDFSGRPRVTSPRYYIVIQYDASIMLDTPNETEEMILPETQLTIFQDNSNYGFPFAESDF